MQYDYDPELLEQLARHGVRPTRATPPALVREFVNDLYRYEIRRLRRRLLRGEFPRADYSREVIALRKRYWIVSVPVQHWTKPGS